MAVRHQMPADFATVARGMRDKESCFRWGISMRTLQRWKRKSGLTRPYRHPDLPREQIQHLTDTMSLTAAAARVGVSRATFRKMQMETGVRP